MKKIILFICIFLFIVSPSFAENKAIFKELDTNYTCYNNNCYDIKSFKYNKLNKTYTINMIIDLMDWNEHQIHYSPYENEYITHLIFKTKFHNNKIIVKYIGFLVGDVIPEYKNKKTVSAHYKISATYMKKPKTIKNIKNYENLFLTWIDKDNYIKVIQTLAKNQED